MFDFLSDRYKLLQMIGGSILVGLLIVLASLLLEQFSTEIVATASLNDSTIDFGKVTCVSLRPKRVTVEGKETPDPKLAKSITDILLIKTVLFDVPYSACPWEFFVNVARGPLHAVRNDSVPAQYLVSVGICERTSDGQIDAKKCLSKNVYVFSRHASTHDFFKVGIIGLRPETPDMKEIRMRIDND